MTPEEAKKVMKEAIKEWLDDQFMTFGRYSFYGLTSALLGAVIYFILKMDGFHK